MRPKTALCFEQLLQAYQTGEVKPGQRIWAYQQSLHQQLFEGTLESVTKDTSRNPAFGHNPVVLTDVQVETERRPRTILYNPKGIPCSYYLSRAAVERV